MDNLYLLVKALHIVFVITWFSGLFYIVRLFIYYVEAEKKGIEEKSILQKQFDIMKTRLWYVITWPSAILAITFGVWLIVLNSAILMQPFMLLKIVFVIFLILYHLLCHKIYINLKNKKQKYTSFKLRIWNEVATVILVSIVFIIVMKNTIDWIYGLLGLIIFSIILLLAVRIYKHVRKK